MKGKRLSVFLMLIVIGVTACKHKTQEASTTDTTTTKTATTEPVIYKGLYSLGPDAKTYKNCATGREYWVRDNTNTLELKYWEIIPHEMPEAPVYIEVEGDLELSSQGDDGGHGDAVGYDSTLVVKKIIKITKDIPAGMCKN